MRLHRLSLMIGAVSGALVMGVASLLGQGASPTEAQEDLRLAVQKSQLMAVTYQLDNSGYHDLDVKLNNGEFVSGALGKVRKGRIATQAAMWPAEMQETANKLVAEMMALETALRNEDVAAAAPRAKAMHDLYHDLSDTVYAWLGGTQPSHQAPSHQAPAQEPAHNHGH